MKKSYNYELYNSVGYSHKNLSGSPKQIKTNVFSQNMIYDDDYKIKTLLTNFQLEKKLLYELAIEYYKKEKNGKIKLIIKDSAYDANNNFIEGMGSLHNVDNKRDCSEFWRAFEYVEKNFNSVKKLLLSKEIEKKEPKNQTEEIEYDLN